MTSTKNDVDTKIDLKADTRHKVAEILQARLTDCLDLSMNAKQAHWNVKGPHFIGLHELFDKIHEAVDGYADLIAERIAQFGILVKGTASVVAKESSLDDYPLEIIDGADHVDALSNSLATFAKNVRKAIDQTDDLGDKGTSDMFTDISRGVDQWLWFVEAHQQARG